MGVACSSKMENWDSELSMGWWNWELTCRSLGGCHGFGHGLVKLHLCSKSHEGVSERPNAVPGGNLGRGYASQPERSVRSRV